MLLSTAAAMLHSSIVRIFTFRMVGSWLTRVMLKPSSVALTDEAICAVALAFAIAVTFVYPERLQLNADSAINIGNYMGKCF